MIVLDTNVVTETYKASPDAGVMTWLESVTGTAITAVTAGEILAGIKILPPGRRRSTLLADTLATIDEYEAAGLVLPFDAAAADHYGDVVASRRRAGRPIKIADAQIAAVCRSAGAVVATRNVADFEECGITAIINPWDLPGAMP